jgi:glycosyltransferase involved in cell wall biosynthesis
MSSFSLAYCTNIWNHYMAAISAELACQLGEDHFKMCLFERVYEEQLKLGWAGAVPDYKWIAGPPSSPRDMDRLRQIVCDADVAVLGACPREIQVARIATGKLTFVMSERMFKQPHAGWRMLNPRYARGIRRFKKLANRENVHYLAMGAYAAEDVQRIGAYGDRIWSWAYFAEVAPQPPQPRVGGPVRILWVGRMLAWKRVDLLLKAVAPLCKDLNFSRVDIVGAGPKENSLRRLARKLNLGDKCVFHAPVPPAQVRELMRQADIYVLPSNRYEGWGVVANEAMSEGAVLVANEQAGAARMLVEHGRTGFLFEDDNVADLTDILKTLLSDIALREKIRQAAWQSMHQLWHPRVGAERLVALSQGLRGLVPMPEYQDGPCCHVAKGMT